MSTESTYESITSKIKNIEGIMNVLNKIMDKNGFNELNDEYQILLKKIPSDTILTNDEKQFGNFGFDVQYYSLNTELTLFEKKLQKYNHYKLINDTINELNNKSNQIFIDNTNLDEYISISKLLTSQIIQIKDEIITQQFTNLLERAINSLFTSLKILSLVNNEELLEFINNKNSDLIRERLGSAIRESIDVTLLKGNIDEDYVNNETIKKCAIKDNNINNLIFSAQEYIKNQQELLKISDDYQKELSTLKSSTSLINIKKKLIKLIIIPAIALPLACPIIGYVIGRKKSNEIDLVKTVTNNVDIDNNVIISTLESYEEMTTRYVASICIASPWKRNLTGVSFSRTCTVYDYELLEEEINNPDFHIDKYNIDENRLMKKYTYEESSDKMPLDKYFTESQMYITETYQVKEDTIKSNKYIFPSIIISFATSIALASGEIILFNEVLEEKLTNTLNDYNTTLESNGKKIKETSENLAKVLKKIK